MATPPKSATTRETTPAVQQFIQLTLDLISEAGGYAAGGVYNADYDMMIRQITVHTAALTAALNAIPFAVRSPPPGA